MQELLALVVFLSLVCLSSLAIRKLVHGKKKNLPLPLPLPLPPGSLGWPVIGETLVYMKAGRDGKPFKFVEDRMQRYDSRVFKTSLLSAPMAVFCGPNGNKFLYSNENKLVKQWWPTSVQKLFGSCLINSVGDEAKRVRKMLMTFLNPDALVRYIITMDSVTQHHIASHWDGKEEVTVYPTIKMYMFELACRLFMSIEDPQHIKKMADLFNVFVEGVIELPINIPGTRFYSAMRAAKEIRKELLAIAQHKKKLKHPPQDLMSHLLVTADDENGKFMTEMEIVNNILTLLFAGHDTSSSVITLVMKYLAELPHVYENVWREQTEIAASVKERGGELLLQWEDIHKMKYSWNVISEVMRINPPVTSGFREALVDFTYAGYTIPKGWKLCWSTGSTHGDPNLFPSEKELFDASRFEGAGPPPFSYVPFGGGPRMCLGKELAKIEMLIFLHNVVKRFNWDLLIPNEKIVYDPMATPVKGVPIRLRPHQSQSQSQSAA